MSKPSVSDEIYCQRDALDILSHGDSTVMLALVNYHNNLLASTFRKIINTYEQRSNCCPTANELIWEASVMLQRNIRDITNEIIKEGANR